MTRKPISEIARICLAINLEVINSGANLFVYRHKGGPLLRSFELFGGAWINADDFNHWWQFMGFDKC